MDRDRIKGKVFDMRGRIQRQVGEWTGNQRAQIAGAALQAKGKVQNTWGKAKDAGRQAVERNQQQNERVNRLQQDRKKEKPAA